MRYSKQREIILRVLQYNPVHPTADYIYALVKKEMPNISLATVYRNLNLLVENGEIKKISGLDNVAHFDHHLHEHHHFICKICGKVYDIEHNFSDNLQKIDGMIVEECEVSLRGICHECNKHKENKKWN